MKPEKERAIYTCRNLEDTMPTWNKSAMKEQVLYGSTYDVPRGQAQTKSWRVSGRM
jgi:hypothetical protein